MSYEMREIYSFASETLENAMEDMMNGRYEHMDIDQLGYAVKRLNELEDMAMGIGSREIMKFANEYKTKLSNIHGWFRDLQRAATSISKDYLESIKIANDLQDSFPPR